MKDGLQGLQPLAWKGGLQGWHLLLWKHGMQGLSAGKEDGLQLVVGAKIMKALIGKVRSPHREEILLAIKENLNMAS